MGDHPDYDDNSQWWLNARGTPGPYADDGLAELSAGPTSIHVVPGANILTNLADTSATVNPQETMLAAGLQPSRPSTPAAFATPLNSPCGSRPYDTFGDPTMAIGNTQQASVHIGNSVSAI